jgi:hypothetical protein
MNLEDPSNWDILICWVLSRVFLDEIWCFIFGAITHNHYLYFPPKRWSTFQFIFQVLSLVFVNYCVFFTFRVSLIILGSLASSLKAGTTMDKSISKPLVLRRYGSNHSTYFPFSINIYLISILLLTIWICLLLNLFSVPVSEVWVEEPSHQNKQ